MSENDNRVSSELYEEFDYSTAITPSLNDESKFNIELFYIYVLHKCLMRIIMIRCGVEICV